MVTQFLLSFLPPFSPHQETIWEIKSTVTILIWRFLLCFSLLTPTMRVWPVSAVLTIWYREHSDPPLLMNLISPCGQRVWGQKQPAYRGLPCQRSLVFRYLIAYRLRGGIWKDPALPFSSSTGGNHSSPFVRAMSLGLCLQLSRGVNSHPLGQPPSNLTLSLLP